MVRRAWLCRSFFFGVIHDEKIFRIQKIWYYRYIFAKQLWSQHNTTSSLPLNLQSGRKMRWTFTPCFDTLNCACKHTPYPWHHCWIARRSTRRVYPLLSRYWILISFRTKNSKSNSDFNLREMEEESVSVIVPAYNCAAYLEATFRYTGIIWSTACLTLSFLKGLGCFS